MGAPATHKSTKNMKKGALGEGPKKVGKLQKNGGPGPSKSMLLYRRGYKNHSFHPAPKTSRKAFQNVIKMVRKTVKPRSGGLLENTAKPNAENNAILTQNRGGGSTNEVVASPPTVDFRHPSAAERVFAKTEKSTTKNAFSTTRIPLQRGVENSRNEPHTNVQFRP